MAGLFDKQADVYLDARPTYPAEWFSMLAARTLHHSLAWDAGTGNGQAAIGVTTIILNRSYRHILLSPVVLFCGLNNVLKILV